MASKNTIPLRSHREFKKIIEEKKKRDYLKTGKMPKSSRITLAMARQYKKYPQFLKELLDSNLK